MIRLTMESLRLGYIENVLICLTFLNELLARPVHAELCQYPPKIVQDMSKGVKTFPDGLRRKKKQEHTERKGRKDQCQNKNNSKNQN